MGNLMNKTSSPKHVDAINGSKEVKNALDYKITDQNREDHHNLVDILFVIDTTGSMSWCFQEAKDTVLGIADMFNKQEYDIKFSLCEYRDHPPQESSFVYRHPDLQGPDSMSSILGDLTASGGGDECEAVMDGLYQGIKLTSWRSDSDGTQSKRFLFHICDAPPHGSKFGGQSFDKEWSKKGCPCKINETMIFKQLNYLNITYNLIECGGLIKMEQIFRNAFGKRFEETMHIKKGESCSETLTRGRKCETIDCEDEMMEDPIYTDIMKEGKEKMCEDEMMEAPIQTGIMKEDKEKKCEDVQIKKSSQRAGNMFKTKIQMNIRRNIS